MKLYLLAFLAILSLGSFIPNAHAATIDANAELKTEFAGDLPKTYGQVIHDTINTGIQTNTSASIGITKSNPLIATDKISTDAELQTVVQKVQSNPSFQLVTADKSAVHVVYTGNGMLFGFLPIPVDIDTVIDADGKTTVSLPWYRFAVTTENTDTVAHAIDVDIQKVAQVPTPSGNLSVNDQASILLAIQAELPNHFKK
jgi:hypothetical protein